MAANLTSVLGMSIADAGKFLEPLAAAEAADPNVVAALADLRQAAVSLKAAIPAVATSLADKIINAGLDAIPVAGPMLAALGAPEIDAFANAVLNALYARVGLEPPAQPVTSVGNAPGTAPSTAAVQAAAVASLNKV